MQLFRSKIKFITQLFIAVGVFLIFFLSWKSNPNLKELSFIPDWLSNWTDEIRNNRRRTAIPFLGLGLIAAAYMINTKRTSLTLWVLTFLIMTIIVCLAEAGQFFLPTRSVDIRDIIWGGLGAGIGLGIPFLVWQLVNKFKTMHFGNK